MYGLLYEQSMQRINASTDRR